MSDDEIERAILRRMFSGEPFTFGDLYPRLPDAAYRMADKLIQRHRRKGHIGLHAEGRRKFWTLTDAGRAFAKTLTF